MASSGAQVITPEVYPCSSCQCVGHHADLMGTPALLSLSLEQPPGFLVPGRWRALQELQVVGTVPDAAPHHVYVPCLLISS